MNPGSKHEPFHTLFHELRAADEQTAPPFNRLAVPKEHRTPDRRRQRWNLRVVAAVAAPVVTAMVLIFSRTANFAPPESAATELIQWHPPTDGLLKWFGDELTSGIPRVGRSFWDSRTNFKQ